MGFKKGCSGNPAGRKPGQPDRRTKLRELLEPQAPALIQKAIAAALAGDMVAMRLCLERCCPALKQQSEAAAIDIDLTGNPVEQSKAILQGVSEGKIAIDDAAQLLGGIASSMKILELTDLEERLRLLEQSQPDNRR